MIVSKMSDQFSHITVVLDNYIQACIFSRLKLLFNFYVKRTVGRQDFDAKFNLTYYNGAPVADILKCFRSWLHDTTLFDEHLCFCFDVTEEIDNKIDE